MFKMSTIHGNTCIQTTVPLRNRCRDDGVHGPAASTPSADVLSTPSHHGSASGRPSLEAYPRCCSPPDSNMNQTEIRFKSGELGGHISGGINSGVSLSLQHGDSVTCTMCWYPILLKKVVIPENRADIRQKHIQQNSILIIITVGSKKCSCVAPRLDTATETISDCTVAQLFECICSREWWTF